MVLSLDPGSSPVTCSNCARVKLQIVGPPPANAALSPSPRVPEHVVGVELASADTRTLKRALYGETQIALMFISTKVRTLYEQQPETRTARSSDGL